MDGITLQAELSHYEQDQMLWEPANLTGRSQALAFARLLLRVASAQRHRNELVVLRQRAIDLQHRCEQVNARVFGEFRQRLLFGEWRGERLRSELDRYTEYRPTQIGQPHFAEDGLDVLVRETLLTSPIPPEQGVRGLGMVHLECTPARVILELVDRRPFTTADCFVDLGSGLGQVVLLVHLLTGVRSRGIEVEPVYCAYAQTRATELGLTDVHFINADACEADLRAGTVFFLFTPFIGAVLQRVIDRLHDVAHSHAITVAAYGACARTLAAQPWLAPLDDHFDHEFKLALFRSRSMEQP
jgi:SAM-dependent methyltransferase